MVVLRRRRPVIHIGEGTTYQLDQRILFSESRRVRSRDLNWGERMACSCGCGGVVTVPTDYERMEQDEKRSWIFDVGWWPYMRDDSGMDYTRDIYRGRN